MKTDRENINCNIQNLEKKIIRVKELTDLITLLRKSVNKESSSLGKIYALHTLNEFKKERKAKLQFVLCNIEDVKAQIKNM
jgi:hypothetical protein